MAWFGAVTSRRPGPPALAPATRYKWLAEFCPNLTTRDHSIDAQG